ncbi:MAG: hypothetical protein KDC46_15485 [Thermoleophilia bacterium]|nr:hypothetical protein [Thermoleophilia bacterium]
MLRTSLHVRALGACATALGVLVLAVASVAQATPTATLLSIDEGANPDAQHVSGSTIWVRSGTTGDFTVRVDATSTNPAGVDYVEFPPIATGWQPQTALQVYAPPYQQTYAWTALAVDPGAPSAATAWDADPSSSDVPFTVAFDDTPPAGTTLLAQTVATRDTSAPVSGSAGTDSQSGIGTVQLRRRTSPISSDVCTSWTAWGNLGIVNPPGPISDPLPTEGCYQYGIVATDNVGNATVVDQTGWLRVDRTAPVVGIDAIDASSVHGNNTVQLGGPAWDSTTSIRTVTVVLADRYSVCSNATVDAATGRWSCSWDIDYAERTGPATLKVSAVDQAGNRTTTYAAVDIKPAPSPFGPREDEIDRVPPVVGLARIPLTSWSEHIRVKPTAWDDRGGYVEVRMESQTASASSTRFSEWSPAQLESQEVTLEDRGETTCYRARAIDEVGNEALSAPRCTTLPLDDTDLNWRGAWDELDVSRAWNGTLHRTTRRWSQLTYRIADPTPLLVVTRCPKCGTIAVYHGTKRVGVYRLAASRTQYRRVIRLRRLTRPASRPLRIVSLTNGRPVYIDALVAGR